MVFFSIGRRIDGRGAQLNVLYMIRAGLNNDIMEYILYRTVRVAHNITRYNKNKSRILISNSRNLKGIHHETRGTV